MTSFQGIEGACSRISQGVVTLEVQAVLYSWKNGKVGPMCKFKSSKCHYCGKVGCLKENSYKQMYIQPHPQVLVNHKMRQKRSM